MEAEGGEDCDHDDLKNNTCSGLGYGGGNLSCDISCTYDTAECLPPTPTPTPSPTPSPTTSPTETTSSTITNQTTSTPQPSASPLIVTPTSLNPTALLDNSLIILGLPPRLQIFDLNYSGKLEREMLYDVVSLWVEEWKSYLADISEEKADLELDQKKCDINSNGVCNLNDFSILLSYVEA